MSEIKFGTDGWRGRIADDYTFANVRRCAEGYARYIRATSKATQPAVVIGYDKRFQSEDFAAAAAEVLAGHGIKVWLTAGPTPTPVIAFAVGAQKADGAINITASHNPPQDNGFKVRDHTGGAIAPAGLAQIEAAIPRSEAEVARMDYDKAIAQGLITLFDPSDAYIANLERLVDLKALADAGLKIVADPMWGNGAGWLPRLIGGRKTEIIEIHNQRNPIFPEMSRPEPIPPNVNVGLAKTKEVGAHCCCITDGDADRCGFGDEHGGFINQLRAYALLALYLLEVRGERGAIVKTLSTTSMLEKLGALYQVPVYETGVGFKYVAPKMLETNAMIGGEESGGYAFRGNAPERDGILANLYFLDLQVRTGKTPSQLIDWLFGKVGPHYYDRIDARIDPAQREAIKARLNAAQPDQLASLRVVRKDTTDGYKFILEDGSWMLIRMSGTEPLMRVYCETGREALVQPLLDAGVKLANGT
ncbi:MAG: phosphoglucomutase/phosphomannomutase family protein [Chloroflexi bacterium]|nr:phosphoglucomutase/phosphomannomutase family protein [Chloroflexota bacterium]